MALLITVLSALILFTVVNGQEELSAACISALQFIRTNPNCLSAFVDIGIAIDAGATLSDADISTACTPSCEPLLLAVATECYEDEAFAVAVVIGCLSNGRDSCAQILSVLSDAGFVALAENSSTTPCGTDDCLTCSQIEELVDYGGCCAYEYANVASDVVGGFSADQIFTICGIANPGSCTEVIIGDSGDATMAKGISIFTLFITAAFTTMIQQ